MNLCKIPFLYLLGIVLISLAGVFLLYFNLLALEEDQFLTWNQALIASIICGLALLGCSIIMLICAISNFRQGKWLLGLLMLVFDFGIASALLYVIFIFLIYANVFAVTNFPK